MYPTLAPSYAGTIGDLLTKSSTAMYLTHLQQSQSKIGGTFQGLGLVGSFKGTVTPSGHIHFTVTVDTGDTGDETLSFDGTIKIGGDLVGEYQVLDRNGRNTGQSGLWSLVPGF